MLPVVLIALTAVIYLAATVLHFAALNDRAREGAVWAQRLSLAGALSHLLSMGVLVAWRGLGALFTIHGGVAVGGLALSGAFVAFAWRRVELSSIGALVAPCAVLSLIPSIFGGTPAEVDGVLGSVLLIVHIVAALLGTAAFVFAFILAVVYLVQQRQLQRKRFHPWLKRLPSLDRLDRLALKVTLLGFFVYTLSILLGSLWAWRHLSLRLEARSLLAVLTWAVYALMIQGRITAGWQGRKAAQLTVAGTLCAVSVIVVYLARA